MTGLALRRGAPADLHAPLPTRASLGLEPLPTDRATAAAQLLDVGAVVAGRSLADGSVSSEELLGVCVDRILERDPALRAVIEIAPDAVEQARASDARRRAGGPLGPLDGIPVTVKANIGVAGLSASAGAEVLARHRTRDADLVARLRQAGVVVLAAANLSELAGAVCRVPGASAVGGRTANPFGSGFTCGGSSSGSAVSVAAGLVPLSVGTETSGSLVSPATFAGVVAIKPSRGVVSGDGVVPLVRFQDTAGPVAGSVVEAALLLDAMAGSGTVPERLDALADTQVGVLRAEVLAQQSPLEDVASNAEMLDRVERGILAAGGRPVDAQTAGRHELETGFLKVVFGGLAHDTMGYVAGTDASVGTLAELHAYNLAEPRLRMPFGQDLLAAALMMHPPLAAYEEGALAVRDHAVRVLDDAFDRHEVDVLVSLSNVHAPLYAAAGYPAVTVPLGLRPNGMPAGATFIGRFGADAAVVEAAYAFEQATLLRVRPTAIDPA